MISVWSGREAHALREAMRMSIDDFAAHLGVSRRSVAKWREGGQAVRLRWDMQRTLDAALAQCSGQERARLTQLLAAPEPGLSRRALWAGAAVSLGGMVTGPSWPTEILADVLVWPPEPTGARPAALIQLERAVARVRMGYQAGRYAVVSQEVPGLLQALVEARHDAEANFPLRVSRLAAGAHHVTASVLLKLGEPSMAMLAAERSAHEAATSGDPLIIAASARIGARVLLRCGQAQRAAALAAGAAQTLKRTNGFTGPRPLSAYGALLLCAAVAAARAGDREAAQRLLGDAAVVADRLGENGNFGWTGFGPANVALHEVSVLLALGDPQAAHRAAMKVDPQQVRLAERQASLYVDTARACHQLGRVSAAVTALERAQAIAPDEVRLRPQTRSLAVDLAEDARGPVRTRAARLVNPD